MKRDAAIIKALMNNWDKTKRRHTPAISAHPKGYISILNAIETLTQNAGNSLLGVKENIIPPP